MISDELRNMLTKLLVLIAVVQAALSQHESAKRCTRAAGACLLAPESMEGPYYWNSTVRRDITEGRPGIPLRLEITVLDTRSCSPVPNAVVDVWQCDGLGVYSHFIAASAGQMNGPTDNSTFFRGQQLSNSKGVAVFDTIYPGWYRGRATHIHVKVHIGTSLTSIGGAIYSKDGHVSHTGQLYFDDRLTDAVASALPYASNTVQRIRNEEDFIYTGSNGSMTLVPIQFLSNEFTGGMKGEITVGVDPTATPSPIGGGLRPPPGPLPSTN